jgi:hypothetical protein
VQVSVIGLLFSGGKNKMEYKVGDVYLSNFKGNIFMGAISLFNLIKYGKSKACHAGIISKVTKDKVYIHEAIETKGTDFKEYEYDKWWLDARIFEGKVIIRRPNLKLTNVEEACKSYEDTYYDWLSILLFPFKLTFNSTKAVFCSEVVARILYDSSGKKLDISSELGIPYDKISPMDLYLSEQLTTVD